LPWTRRIITPVRSALVGLVQCRVRLVVVADVTVGAVTGFGGAMVAPARVYPVTSTIKWTVPQEPLNSWIFPPVPTGTMTVFGMFCPAWKFRFEVSVLSIPNGQTVMYPAVCGDTAVTFNTTAATLAVGTPP